MSGFRRFLFALIGIELAVATALTGLRLNSTRLTPPLVDQYNDALTGRELLELPDQYLFDSLDKWRTLGETYLALGYFAKADACFRKAAELEPASPEIAFVHGHCLERLGQVDEALALFERAATSGSRSVSHSARYQQGRNLLRLERKDDAARAFEGAGSDHLPSVYQRARLLVREGLDSEATPLLKVLLAEHPRDLHVLLLQAQAATEQGNGDEARSARDAAELATNTLLLEDSPPQLAAIREGLGIARELARINQAQFAGDTAGAASRLLPFTDDSMRWQNKFLYLLQEAAALQIQAGDLNAAETLLNRQFDELGFPTATAWELRGDLAMARNDLEGARGAWERAARIANSSTIHLKLAALAEQEKDSERHRHEFALAGESTGVAQYRAGRIAEGVTTLRRALSLDAGLPRAWFYLGECERLQGRTREASAAYRRCAEIMPWHGRAQARLAPP
jgi:tetratricopeptide (TPR) repeat protein